MTNNRDLSIAELDAKVKTLRKQMEAVNNPQGYASGERGRLFSEYCDALVTLIRKEEAAEKKSKKKKKR